MTRTTEQIPRKGGQSGRDQRHLWGWRKEAAWTEVRPGHDVGSALGTGQWQYIDCIRELDQVAVYSSGYNQMKSLQGGSIL